MAIINILSKIKKKMKYTGFNKILKADWIQTLLDKRKDGSLKEFIEDWKWIFSFSKRYKGFILLYTLLGLFSSSFALGSSYASRILINIITGKEMDKLVFLMMTMIFLSIFSIGFSSLMSRVSAHISVYVHNDIQSEIFDNIIDAKWIELNKFTNGDLLNRFNNDVSTISANAIAWIPNLVINIYTFLLTFIVLIKMDMIMAFIAVLSAPFLFLMSHYILSTLRKYRRKVLELNSDMMSFEVDTFYNLDTIKSLDAQADRSDTLRKWQKEYKRVTLDYNKFEIKTKVLMNVVSTFVSFVAFGYCLYRLWGGMILFGDMTFFLTQRVTLSNRFNSLVSTFPSMIHSAVSAHRIKELVSLEKEDHTSYDLKDFNELSIEIDDMSFAYKENNMVYESACFKAKSNEIIGLIGESGSGKTTLFRLLLSLISPNKGHIYLIDNNDNKYEINADLRKYISYVPQGNTMMMGTIKENMLLVKKDAIDEEIIHVLKLADAYEFVDKIGLNAPLKERGKGLSEGQAQRLAIARALLKDAPILILDEATSALDDKTETIVLNNILNNSKDKTIIISTHKIELLDKCHKVYKIQDKQIIERDL